MLSLLDDASFFFTCNVSVIWMLIKAATFKGCFNKDQLSFLADQPKDGGTKL